jgi:fatty acid desaturase (delta-4 desaturase)
MLTPNINLNFFAGELFVRAFAGKDATDAFMSYHRRKFPHDTVKSALIGGRGVTHALSFDKDYLELCEILEKVLPRHKSFAPTRYFVKIFFLIALAVGLEVSETKFRNMLYIIIESPF